MKPARRLAWAVAAFCLAASPLSAADPDKGRKLARKCSVCHGKNGMARDPEVPNLAGQSAFYLQKTLKDFRSGVRGGSPHVDHRQKPE